MAFINLKGHPRGYATAQAEAIAISQALAQAQPPAQAIIQIQQEIAKQKNLFNDWMQTRDQAVNQYHQTQSSFHKKRLKQQIEDCEKVMANIQAYIQQLNAQLLALQSKKANGILSIAQTKKQKMQVQTLQEVVARQSEIDQLKEQIAKLQAGITPVNQNSQNEEIKQLLAEMKKLQEAVEQKNQPQPDAISISKEMEDIEPQRAMPPLEQVMRTGTDKGEPIPIPTEKTEEEIKEEVKEEVEQEIKEEVEEAIKEAKEEAKDEAAQEEKKKKLKIILIAGGVVLLGVITFLLLRRKKK